MVRYFLLAEVRMKATEDGGRAHAFLAGYCPHLCSDEVKFIAVRVEAVSGSQTEEDWMSPGERGEVIFSFFYCDPTSGLPYGFDSFTEGRDFEIVEGPRVVGTGRTLQKWSEMAANYPAVGFSNLAQKVNH